MAATPDTPIDPRQRSTADLLKELVDQVTTLARKEIELAKAETAEKAKAAATGAGEFAGAAVFGIAALGALTACFIAGLSMVVPVWAGALIVALVYLLIAGVLVLDGRKRLQRGTPPIPESTPESVKEDVRWATRRQTS